MEDAPSHAFPPPRRPFWPIVLTPRSILHSVTHHITLDPPTIPPQALSTVRGELAGAEGAGPESERGEARTVGEGVLAQCLEVAFS